MLRLVTIPISHYCEKARWALERAGIPYREERHVQGIHRIAARRAGGGRTVPVLVTPEGALGESEEILLWVDGHTPPEQRLFPSVPAERAEVERLCRRFDERLGPGPAAHVRQHARPARADAALQQSGRAAMGGSRAAAGVATRCALRGRALGIRPGVEVEDEAAVWGELDFVAELLADGREHLCGERFSAADLTFAALSASVIVPPVYGVPLPQPDVLPPEIAALIERVRAHPAGRYALALFNERRRDTVA